MDEWSCARAGAGFVTKTQGSRVKHESTKSRSRKCFRLYCASTDFGSFLIEIFRRHLVARFDSNCSVEDTKFCRDFQRQSEKNSWKDFGRNAMIGKRKRGGSHLRSLH